MDWNLLIYIAVCDRLLAAGGTTVKIEGALLQTHTSSHLYKSHTVTVKSVWDLKLITN